jgi:hypothetical protein
VIVSLILSVIAGWVAVYSSTGWARYRISSVMQNPVVLSLAITGEQYRLCINLACTLPAQVSSHLSQLLLQATATSMCTQTSAKVTAQRCCATQQLPCMLQATGIQVTAAGWVSTEMSSQGDVILGSPTGRSMAGTIQGLWVLPGAVAFDSLATAGQTVADVLTAITAPSSVTAAGPSVSLQVQTAAPVVGAPVSVAVGVSAAAGTAVQARVTFWGAPPR